MATEEFQPPEGMTAAEEPQTNNEYDTEWVDRPMLNQAIQGTLLARKENRGKHDSTILEVKLSEPYADPNEEGGDYEAGDLICFWSTQGINTQLEAEEVRRGDEFAVACTETYENENGDEVRSYTVYS